MSIGIYKITSPSGKIYIGQSINIKNRWKNYTRVFSKNTKIFKSFQKYGYINHKFEIIEECSIEQLNERETYWKLYYLEQFSNNWKQVLFHELYDGGGGPKSTSTKQKIGISNKKPKPEGFNLLISKPILQYNLDGNFIREWISITEAKQVYNGDIQSCLSGKQKTASNYIWVYKQNNYKTKIFVNLENKHKGQSKSSYWVQSKYKPIIQMDLNNNFIKEWPSIKSIVEELNFSQSSISNCCLGKIKTSYKFKWKYKE